MTKEDIVQVKNHYQTRIRNAERGDLPEDFCEEDREMIISCGERAVKNIDSLVEKYFQ